MNENRVIVCARQSRIASSEKQIAFENARSKTPTVWKNTQAVENPNAHAWAQVKPEAVCEKCRYELETGFKRKGRHSCACPLFGKDSV